MADEGRGRVVNLEFEREIKFNGLTFWRAEIELDHINHGLDKTKSGLNKRARTNFSAQDIVKFLMMLDGEFVKEFSKNKQKTLSRFVMRIDCPIPGPHFQKTFRMVFETKKKTSGQFFVVTLYKD